MQYDEIGESEYCNCNLKSLIDEMHLLSNSVDKA